MRDRFAYAALLHVFAALICFLATAQATHAEGVSSNDQVAAKPGEPIAFNISSRSLDEALLAYSERTRYTALVDSARTAGRRSGSATGVLTPEQALSDVLKGTGLVAQFSSPTAFMLVPAPQTKGGESATATSAQHRNYFAAIQFAIRRALCSDQATRPGSYRAALQIWIDGAGVIQHSELFGSTDIPDRDAKIRLALLNAAIGAPLPEGLPQPVTVVLTPRSADAGAECTGIRADLR